MLLAEVATYLHGLGIGVFDEDSTTGNIFIENLPEAPDTAIALYSQGGYAPDTRTGLERPSVQVIVRGDTDPRTAHDLAQRIIDAIHGQSDTHFSAGGHRIVLCAAAQSHPVRLGKDKAGRYEYSLNFNLLTEA